MLHLKATALLAALATLCACSEQDDYSPVSFRAEGNRLIATGTIDGTTMERFVQARRAHPNARILVLQNIPGSADDDANLAFSRYIHKAGFTTIVPSDGMVASGGTDLFLAGKTRILEKGACVGVHSWGDGVKEGDKVPRDDPQHQVYFDYYDTIGIERAFYWFTLEAAPAADIHWMSTAEAVRFHMTTQPPGALAQGESCEQR